jgi:hypothetical protein
MKYLQYWLGIKYDYRTLVGLEGDTVVNISADIEEEDDDE